MQKLHIGIGLSLFALVILSVCVYLWLSPATIRDSLLQKKERDLPLLAYTLENLQKTDFKGSAIRIEKELPIKDGIRSYVFSFLVPQSPVSEQTKKVTGVLTVPNTHGTYPIIIMLRGFVSPEEYTFGSGTNPVAREFARAGFMTLAPDFLGYGESEQPSSDVFEARFQSYTTVLSLLSSLSKVQQGLDASFSGKLTADTTKVGLWGHSNGGHIALAILAITQKEFPTVVWAPVSKSFPYSILYYTDETDDQGKALRQSLAQFEYDYDTAKFSYTNYLENISAPLSIYQGTKDQEVPVWWSDELVQALKEKKKDVVYHTYEGADHSLRPNGWSPAVLSSIEFYTKTLQ